MSCELGVYGLAVMGVNLALNAASKGFRVCVGNRTPAKVDTALELAKEQGLEEKIFGAKDMKVFVRLKHQHWSIYKVCFVCSRLRCNSSKEENTKIKVEKGNTNFKLACRGK